MTEGENTTGKYFTIEKKRQLLSEFLLPVAPKCLFFPPFIFPDDDVSHKKSKPGGISCSRQPIYTEEPVMIGSQFYKCETEVIHFQLLGDYFRRTESLDKDTQNGAVSQFLTSIGCHNKVIYPRLAHNTIHPASSGS